MSMYTLGKRSYIKGKKVTVSIRLPEELKKKLVAIAKDRGHGFSDFVQEGLDQWAYAHEKKILIRDKSGL